MVSTTRAVAVLVAAVAGVLQAQDAPMFRGDLARTGVYAATSSTPPAGIKWKFATGGPIVSSPAVVAGVAYVGSTDGFLYAIDAESGVQRWKFQTSRRISSSPTVVGNVVYFVSYDSFVYAIDIRTGTLKWKFATAGERRFSARALSGTGPAGETMPDTWDFYLSSPAVLRDVVYVGSGDGNVYAIDAESGKLRWKFATGNVVHASPAIANDMVYVGSWSGVFYALEAGTGRVRWQFQAGVDTAFHNQQGFQGSPAISNGTVFVGARDSHVYALDARSGAKKWEFPVGGAWVSSSPAVRDARVYVGTGDSGLLLVLDAATGKEVARVNLGWMIFSSPALAGNLLYVGTFDGYFAAVDLTTHMPVWTFQSDSARVNRPKYTGNDGKIDFAKLVAERFYDDFVVRVSKIFGMGSFMSSPSIVNGVVYVASTDGNLYAFK